jgi:hypothetical protein
MRPDGGRTLCTSAEGGPGLRAGRVRVDRVAGGGVDSRAPCASYLPDRRELFSWLGAGRRDQVHHEDGMTDRTPCTCTSAVSACGSGWRESIERPGAALIRADRAYPTYPIEGRASPGSGLRRQAPACHEDRWRTKPHAPVRAAKWSSRQVFYPPATRPDLCCDTALAEDCRCPDHAA